MTFVYCDNLEVEVGKKHKSTLNMSCAQTEQGQVILMNLINSLSFLMTH